MQQCSLIKQYMGLAREQLYSNAVRNGSLRTQDDIFVDLKSKPLVSNCIAQYAVQKWCPYSNLQDELKYIHKIFIVFTMFNYSKSF